MELQEIKEKLLEICKQNGGYCYDIDILFTFPKDNLPQIGKITESEFISKFNEYKTLIKGRKAVTRGLSEQAKGNLKKLVERGYTWTDLRCAIDAMYQAPKGMKKGWAESTGNDNPNHLLRENNFERYLNIYHNGSEKQQERTVADKRNDAINRVLGKG